MRNSPQTTLVPVYGLDPEPDSSSQIIGHVYARNICNQVVTALFQSFTRLVRPPKFINFKIFLNEDKLLYYCKIAFKVSLSTANRAGFFVCNSSAFLSSDIFVQIQRM